MSLTKYYILDSNEPQNDTSWLATLGTTLANIVVEIGTTGVASKTIKFAVGVVAETNTNYTVDEITFDISTTNDPNRVQIGDDLYYIDTIADSITTEAVTLAIISSLGIAPLSIVGLAIAGVTTYVYSKFLDPITDDVLQTLAGKDTVQFFDVQGEHTSGIIYGDGIPAGSSGVAALDAVWAFITNENSAGLDLTGGHIQVDTGLGVDDNYYVYDGAIYETIANTLDISLIEFRTTQNHSLTNDAYFAEAGHGNYIFFEEDTVEIGIPVTIGGADTVVMVQNVYGNGTVSEATRLIGDDELFEENLVLANGTGTGGDGRDLVLGGSGGDVITGGDGDDILIGGLGNDTIEASEDDDTIDGGNGEDWIDYTVLDSYLDNDVSVNLTLNNSTISYLLDDDHQDIFNVEHIKTGGGDDLIVGDSNANEINAGDGDDKIYGEGGNDTLIGGTGNDYIESGGDSALFGGAGLDFYEDVQAGDVIMDADGGRINGISFVYGSEGKLLWRDGAGVNPFVFKGADLHVYTNVIVEQAPADKFFVIKDFLSQNDGRWGFSIPTEFLHTENDLILSANGTPTPSGDVNPEDSNTPLSTPTSGHPNEQPDATHPTLLTFDTNQVERGYTAHQNYFAVTKGYDTKYGGTEQDTYEWGSGFHDDVIVDAGGLNDRVVLSNLNASDVSIVRVSDDIHITVTATGEKLTIENAYIAENAVETLEFADGSTLSLALSISGHSNATENIESTGTVDDVIVALAGDDTIYAWHGDDSIDAGAGNDLINTQDGNDTINGGDDNDTITSGVGNDSIDGGVGSDSIYASIGEDTLRGGTGDDTLEGYLGGDTYIWAAGDGNDIFEESGFSGGGIDTVWLTGGIIASDVTVYGTVGNDVHISHISTGEVITLQGQFADSDKIIENLTFDDGSIINLSAISEWRGDETNNDIDGTSGGDTIIGHAGNDTLGGYRGDDTYIWQSGDGNDLIQETNVHNSGTDTLALTGGITLADLDIYGTTGSDVNITYIPTGETITIDNQLSSNSRYHIESLTFDDGSVHSFSGFEVRGASGNDSLYGGNYNDTLTGNEGDDRLSSGVGNDVIIGGAGNDLLLGYRGDDTYVWAAGDGNDLIQESNIHLSGANDILLLTGGITQADVTFSQVSNDLLITHTPTGEVITIDNQYSSNSRYDIETLQFDDGTTLDLLGV